MMAEDFLSKGPNGDFFCPECGASENGSILQHAEGCKVIERIASMANAKESSSFTQSFDAREWAKAFVQHVKENPSIATDEATMIGWFSNALMRGYDEHVAKTLQSGD